jgi:Mrp family chromosome partitioning ATPase
MFSKLFGGSDVPSIDRLALDRMALHLRQDNDGAAEGRIFVVTSAQPGEGKSLIARLLAQAASRHQEGDVLLVDAGITANPGEAASAGFAELLSGTPLDGLVTQTPNPLLWQLWRGNGYHASQLFRGARLRSVLDKVRARFPLTVIDAPELSACGALLALVDQAVIVVDTRVTTGEAVKQALDTALGVAGVSQERIAGVVLNRQTKRQIRWTGG